MEGTNLDFMVNLSETDSPQASVPQPAKPKTEPATQRTASSPPKPAPLCGIFSVDYWKQYFDVSEEEVKHKLQACLNPTTSTFEQLIEQKVDLYGPFWICTTFIFVLIFAPRFWKVVLFNDNTFDVSKIGFSFTLVYGSVALFTLVFWIINRCWGSNVELFKAASVYGYSYTIFVIAGVCTIISFPLLKFVLAICAGFHSVLFLLKNFKGSLEKLDKSSQTVSLVFILVLQTFMTLMIYFHYFK